MASVNPLQKLRFRYRTKRDSTHDAVAAFVPQPATTGSTAGRLSPHSAVLSASPAALQETSDSLSSTQSLPDRLWNRAYDALKEEDSQLVDTYERLLSHELEGDPTSTDLSSQKNSIEQDSLEKRRHQMTQLVVAGLKKTEREANVKRDVEKGMQAVSSTKALMDAAVKAYPEASLAWAGVCIILEMLASPVKQTTANREGIAYVISRMEWYRRLSSLLLDENKAKGNHGGLRDELEKHVVALYKTLLAYQMKSVYSYYRSRHIVFWRDVVTLDDWSDTLETIYHSEKTVRENSAAYNTESIKGRLENLAEAAKSQQETLLPGIHQANRDHTAAQREMLQEKETMECLKHLRATDPRDDKKRIERTKGGFLTDASKWILHHPDFRHWRDDDQSQLLWIKGDPGKGKTMLLIGIVKELELASALADNPTAKPAYFLCQDSDSRHNNATAVLRSLIYLLVVQRPLLMSHLRKKYDHAGEGLFKDVNAFVALSEVFATMLRDPSITKAYIIVDALDECETDQKHLITSYETVKYFNAEQYEFRRYRNSIQDLQKFELKVIHGTSTRSTCQTLAMISGFLVVTTLGAYAVSYVAYFQQLQPPLNFFRTLCRTTGLAMTSAERVLELFKVQPTVVDSPNAKKLDSCSGRIRWSGVKFAYDWRKSTLRDLSFECVPGTTTAFAGESGGGKSTVFRLLYRYFNFNGSIEIDGHDVRELTIDSVRRHMGVVPQHTILSNETLMYNLRYANQNATDEEIFTACRLAHIHDRITTFPESYQAEVGERGLRLSDGTGDEATDPSSSASWAQSNEDEIPLLGSDQKSASASSTSIPGVSPLGEPLDEKRFWWQRSQGFDGDAIATQESVYDDPALAKRYEPRPDWENIHRFDPSARWTWNEEHKLVRKIDVRIMIFACVTFMALQLDRANLTQALSDNFLSDLGLDTNGSSMRPQCARTH
ncbi:hypothetical protein QQX98_000060 [Neonectria punicea]|uniref:NACHT domain-containing protein n=1 Tax=Neonectria punicea TaxID=979145 RepID=A0ABR1HX05_9HYPO